MLPPPAPRTSRFSLTRNTGILPPDGRMLVLSQFLGDLRSLVLRPPSRRPAESRCTGILPLLFHTTCALPPWRQVFNLSVARVRIPQVKNSWPRINEGGLPGHRTAAGIGGSSRSFLHEKHDIVSFFLGKRSLLVLRFASCEAAPNRSRDRRKLEELLDFSPLLGKARLPRLMAKKPLRRDFCRPGGAQPKTQTLIAARSNGADPVSF